jgi:hypothetical protein
MQGEMQNGLGEEKEGSTALGPMHRSRRRGGLTGHRE